MCILITICFYLFICLFMYLFKLNYFIAIYTEKYTNDNCVAPWILKNWTQQYSPTQMRNITWPAPQKCLFCPSQHHPHQWEQVTPLLWPDCFAWFGILFKVDNTDRSLVSDFLCSSLYLWNSLICAYRNSFTFIA